jgi:hypothetical protein
MIRPESEYPATESTGMASSVLRIAVERVAGDGAEER